MAVTADLAFSWLDQMMQISALFMSGPNKSDTWKRIVLPYQVKLLVRLSDTASLYVNWVVESKCAWPWAGDTTLTPCPCGALCLLG